MHGGSVAPAADETIRRPLCVSSGGQKEDGYDRTTEASVTPAAA